MARRNRLRKPQPCHPWPGVQQRADQWSANTLLHPPLALYVHLPWCVRKCPYCDFNSHEFKPPNGIGTLPFAAYVDALVADLDFDLPLVRGRMVQTVFFGGGTPSLFPAEAIDAFLQAASGRLRFAPGLEVTLETNPGTAEHGRFEGYRAAGVNRLSFGIQSFDDGCLQRLGRIHDSAQAVVAVEQAQDAGLDNINIDLMYALPGQSLAMAEHDVERAIALSPEHISHYQLTLEPNTVFAAQPPSDLPGHDAAWDMQERCQALIAGAGYAQYEISAYARPGRQCAHNRNYWGFGDYLGIGAGAHGKLTLPAANADHLPGRARAPAHDDGTILRRWKVKHPAQYLAHAGTAAAIGGDEQIGPARRPFDYMLNALRLVQGFGLAEFETRTGLDRSTIAARLGLAEQRGWLTFAEDRIVPTEFGLRFGNDVIALFLDD